MPINIINLHILYEKYSVVIECRGNSMLKLANNCSPQIDHASLKHVSKPYTRRYKRVAR